MKSIYNIFSEKSYGEINNISSKLEIWSNLLRQMGHTLLYLHHWTVEEEEKEKNWSGNNYKWVSQVSQW